MAAPSTHPARSRRYIKIYLVAWAVLATGALAYLTFLAFPQSPQQVAQRVPAADAEAGPTLRAVAKSLAEMGVAVRRGFADVQKDVTHLKEVMVDQDGKSKAAEVRLNSLEERVATIEATRDPASPSSKAKAPDPKTKASRKSSPLSKTSDARVTPHVINAPPPSSPPRENPKPARQEPPLETGSIAKSQQVVFGDPVVRPTTAVPYAVQLAASPSLDGLRQRWDQLVDQHGSLATLQPRVVQPRGGGGPYRLVAGPIETKADADRLCADMRVARTSCFATPYSGSPL
jgi:hypothetical protein